MLEMMINLEPGFEGVAVPEAFFRPDATLKEWEANGFGVEDGQNGTANAVAGVTIDDAERLDERAALNYGIY
jgi:hypothetical protein